ncbi:citrate synthase/methylcitrate synthase [Paenibacillus sp. IB182496]|uniref:Citrate synthase n=1 Tax=Paenibacillus sabuli TaxID=2772509 RepID=A0A927BWK9_9BACL|nr:citrate synthase/methylcitrate synthase [Paenibacillus sabuli]MBD2846970.1 citrate synthase/methylcitrate synthase [Paenibacillus sabuli]
MAQVTGLEGVVAADTDIALVDGEQGKLIYRGIPANQLAVRHTYAEAAHLLWHGGRPDANRDAAAQTERRLADKRELSEDLRAMLDALPLQMPMMAVLQSAVAAFRQKAPDTGHWPPTVEQAERITAAMPTIIAHHARRQARLEPLAPDPELGHTANYLYMLTGQRPAAVHVRALDAYFILCMEHGLNASTFAARVILSTQADLYAAVSGAIGAMKGPLHGGAPYEVIAMLEQIGTAERAESWLRELLERGGRIMGFGHRIYRTQDPRAQALREVTAALVGDDPAFALALHVEETALRLLAHYKPGRRLYTNVEFFAAAVLRALQLPPELFTPTFTAGRIVGWTAHALEQARVNRIFRPQSRYTGPLNEQDTPPS